MKESIDITQYYAMEPKPHTVRIPEKLMQIAKIEAKKEGRSLGKYITAAVAEKVNRDSQGKMDV